MEGLRALGCSAAVLATRICIGIGTAYGMDDVELAMAWVCLWRGSVSVCTPLRIAGKDAGAQVLRCTRHECTACDG